MVTRLRRPLNREVRTVSLLPALPHPLPALARSLLEFAGWESAYLFRVKKLKFASCVCFLGLPEQVHKLSCLRNNRRVFPHSSGDRNPESWCRQAGLCPSVPRAASLLAAESLLPPPLSSRGRLLKGSAVCCHLKWRQRPQRAVPKLGSAVIPGSGLGHCFGGMWFSRPPFSSTGDLIFGCVPSVCGLISLIVDLPAHVC